MKVAVIIPSLNPDEKFTEVVSGMVEAGFGRIYVVDDGSAPEYHRLFESAAAMPGVTLLRHEVNRGKGRALKTALARYLEDGDDEFCGVVTVDGDGQHSPEDAQTVADALLEGDADALVLGARDFSGSDVPARSAFGNKLTRQIFRLLFGLNISDTQTGLRAIPNAFAWELLKVEGERYEFETNMLLQASKLGIAVREVPIRTIYLDDNSASHFRPFQDSLRIYGLMLRFGLSSLISSLADIALFGVIAHMLRILSASRQLLLATVLARICSAVLNFTLNRRLVFHSRASATGSLVRYGLLASVQMLLSYGGVYLLSVVAPLGYMTAKLITDTILFLLSFRIQQKWVF